VNEHRDIDEYVSMQTQSTHKHTAGGGDKMYFNNELTETT